MLWPWEVLAESLYMQLASLWALTTLSVPAVMSMSVASMVQKCLFLLKSRCSSLPKPSLLQVIEKMSTSPARKKAAQAVLALVPSLPRAKKVSQEKLPDRQVTNLIRTLIHSQSPPVPSGIRANPRLAVVPRVFALSWRHARSTCSHSTLVTSKTYEEQYPVAV